MNITSEISNLPLFEENKKCIVFLPDEKGYWWGFIEDIEIYSTYLKLKIELNKGPFSVKEGKPIYSNESAPYAINAEALPDLPVIRNLILRNISLNEEIKRRKLDNNSYKHLYDNIIDKLTGHNKYEN